VEPRKEEVVCKSKYLQILFLETSSLTTLGGTCFPSI